MDEALGKLVIDGNWRTLPMRLDLGTLLVDTRAMRVDEWLYYNMDKNDNTADLFHCEKAWKKATMKAPASDKEEKKNPAKMVTAKVTSNKVKQLIIGNKLTKCVVQRVEDKVNEGVGNKYMGGDRMCLFCDEHPCVWLLKKEEMLDFDDNEHGHLPLEDWPPNNIHRRKIYQQMTLFINDGPLGKGVCKQLPKCIDNGCLYSFPSLVFMGFKESLPYCEWNLHVVAN
jgi:hypothetical protein